MTITQESRPTGAGGAAKETSEGTRSNLNLARGSNTPVHVRGRRGSRFSPWGELYAQLCRAEALERKLSRDEHAELVRQRGADAVQRLTSAREAAQGRRERVLRHPDLAERLRQVLGLSSAAHWNGWVPPRTDPEQACDYCNSGRRCPREHVARLNTSPRRTALVEIAAEAYAREAAA